MSQAHKSIDAARGDRESFAGQRAMAMAFLYPDPEKGGRGKKTVLSRDGFSKARLSQARQILRFSYELACAVRATTQTGWYIGSNFTSRNQFYPSNLRHLRYSIVAALL